MSELVEYIESLEECEKCHKKTKIVNKLPFCSKCRHYTIPSPKEQPQQEETDWEDKHCDNCNLDFKGIGMNNHCPECDTEWQTPPENEFSEKNSVLGDYNTPKKTIMTAHSHKGINRKDCNVCFQGFSKCSKCLANYSKNYPHKCDGLIKILAEFHKKKVKVIRAN